LLVRVKVCNVIDARLVRVAVDPVDWHNRGGGKNTMQQTVDVEKSLTYYVPAQE